MDCGKPPLAGATGSVVRELDNVTMLVREYRKYSDGRWREWLDALGQRPMFPEPPSSVVAQMCAVLCHTTLDLVRTADRLQKVTAALKSAHHTLKFQTDPRLNFVAVYPLVLKEIEEALAQPNNH